MWRPFYDPYFDFESSEFLDNLDNFFSSLDNFFFNAFSIYAEKNIGQLRIFFE